MAAASAHKPVQMFPFSISVQVNDESIKEFCYIARMEGGIKDVNWTFEWLDAGRARFSFDSEMRLGLFRFNARCLELID